MEKMKNMMVIKDIKSNLVEEAIIVFKENVKIKEKQFLRQSSNEKENKGFNKDYCVKEAEEIITGYLKKIEEKKKDNNMKIKLRALKILNISLVLTLLLVLIF